MSGVYSPYARRFPTGTSDPATGVEGQVYWKSDTDVLRIYNGSAWGSVGAAAGDVTGPASSTDNAAVRFDGAGGKTLQNSVVLIGDTGAITGAISLALNGATSGTATIAPPAIAGTTSVTLPNASSTLPIFGQQVTFTGPTAARSYALPDSAQTLAGLGVAQTWTAVQTFGANVLFSADNTHDIGASGATRPKDVYIAGRQNIGTSTIQTGVPLTLGRAGSGALARLMNTSAGVGDNTYLEYYPAGIGPVRVGGDAIGGGKAEYVIQTWASSTATEVLRVLAGAPIGIQINAGPKILVGTGSPESAVTAGVGSLFLRTDGGASTVMYVKESGAGNTGWIAK